MKRSALMILSSLVLSTALSSAFAAGHAPVTAPTAQVAPTRLDPAARSVKPERVKPTEAAPGGQAAQAPESRRPQRGPRAGHPAPPKPGETVGKGHGPRGHKRHHGPRDAAQPGAVKQPGQMRPGKAPVAQPGQMAPAVPKPAAK